MIGSLMSIIGAIFVVMYIVKAVIERIGENDQSLLFWYLPVLFMGLLGIKFGIKIGFWGKHMRETLGQTNSSDGRPVKTPPEK